MPTLSVTKIPIKEDLSTRIRILFFENEGFFSPNSAFHSHINDVFSTYTLVLRPVHTYRAVFGKWRNRRFFTKSKRLREAY